MEREAIGVRTSAVMQHKKAQGEYTGGRIPFGFKLAEDGKHLVENPIEQEIMNQARELRTKGLNFRKIGLRLAEQGYFGRTGKVLHTVQVKRMLVA